MLCFCSPFQMKEMDCKETVFPDSLFMLRFPAALHTCAEIDALSAIVERALILSGVPLDGFLEDIFFIAVPFNDIVVCFVFQFIRQRIQPNLFPVFSRQSLFQKIIAHVGIFRKERAVEVGGDHILVNDPFIAGFPSVSKAEEYLSERRVVSDVGASPVVFKARDRCVE